MSDVIKIPVVDYKITVYTGNVDFAGTDAKVYITLHGKNQYGEDISSSEIKLGTHGKYFEKGKIDTFLIKELKQMESIEFVEIRHDNTGIAPGWFLEKIIVKDDFTKDEFTFICQDWLTLDSPVNRISRILFAKPR
jgi:lipoxygenase homology domain-containing protein 1